MQYIIETERLGLREFTLRDSSFIVELLNSPGWLQFIGDRNVHTEDEAIQYLQNGPLKSYRENRFGLSLVEIKDSGVAIGMCGLVDRPQLGMPDLGFAFLPAFHGSGYAFEIASATLWYAKSVLGFLAIAAITMPANARSIRLLEKAGFSLKETVIFPPGNEELLLFIHEHETTVPGRGSHALSKHSQAE